MFFKHSPDSVAILNTSWLKTNPPDFHLQIQVTKTANDQVAEKMLSKKSNENRTSKAKSKLEKRTQTVDDLENAAEVIETKLNEK